VKVPKYQVLFFFLQHFIAKKYGGILSWQFLKIPEKSLKFLKHPKNFLKFLKYPLKIKNIKDP